MAVFILGYRVDPAFMAFFKYACARRRYPDWQIEWANENAEMQGNGIMRFGQIRRGLKSEGINIGLLLDRGVNALKIAQKSDRRRHNVLFASATTEQLLKLTNEERDKGYAIIKDGRVPLLIEYANAVLVWGTGWHGPGSEEKIGALFKELIWTFVFPDEEQVVCDNSPVLEQVVPVLEHNDLSSLEGCG